MEEYDVAFCDLAADEEAGQLFPKPRLGGQGGAPAAQTLNGMIVVAQDIQVGMVA